MAKNPKFDAFLDRMRDTHDRKNADYASGDNPYSNFEEAAHSAGCSVDMVFAVLIGIKQARIKELTTKDKTPNNESLQDSRLDMAVYAALRASYFAEPYSDGWLYGAYLTGVEGDENERR